MRAIDLIGLILDGALVTIQLTAAGCVVALVAAFAAGLARLSSIRAVRWTAVAYVEFFRGTSVFVQLFWAYFVLPLFGIPLTPMQTGILILGLNVGAYASEVVRGGIRAVPREQYEACTALNLTVRQRMLHIVLPQAFVIMLPALGNSAIELLKGTSVVSLISLADMTFQAQVVRGQTGETAVPFLTILVLYYAMSSLIGWSTRNLERRLSAGLDVTKA